MLNIYNKLEWLNPIIKTGYKISRKNIGAGIYLITLFNFFQNYHFFWDGIQEKDTFYF